VVVPVGRVVVVVADVAAMSACNLAMKRSASLREPRAAPAATR